MVQESKNKLDYQEFNYFNTETKRVRKMNDKELTISSFTEQTSAFDVDTVMKKSGTTNHPDKVVSTKKLLTKRVKKSSQRPKRIEVNS